jgi:hypothetical protein
MTTVTLNDGSTETSVTASRNSDGSVILSIATFGKVPVATSARLTKQQAEELGLAPTETKPSATAAGTATLPYNGRTYRVARVPFAKTLFWSEGADERTATDIPYNAVPPTVRETLLHMLDAANG